MRKREIVSVRWEVRCADGHAIVAAASTLGGARMHRRKFCTRRARVFRITRYRLAPLVEVSGWRHNACGDLNAGACVPGESHAWDAWGDGVMVSGDGGRPEAEAALRLLGFRVAK